MKVLISVYNISGYLMAELAELAKSAEIAVIETPCGCIPKGNSVSLWIDRTKVTDVANLESALGDFKPDVFLCGGWADKVCLELAKHLHRRGTKTVLLVDTPWQGKLKQFVHCLYSRFYLTTTFDYAWGAGAPQERYLRYLGFPKERIRQGYYCADTNKFAAIGAARFSSSEERKSEKSSSEEFKFKNGISALELELATRTISPTLELQTRTKNLRSRTRTLNSNSSPAWPHTFLYIGRYVPVKNMRRMERAFIRAIEQMPESDWTLRCIGGGQLWDERTIHPRIEHLGYKSPGEIQEYVKDAGCFVLPSVYEPWGVVVHEAALMGLPMLCSNQIQAATKFLVNGENGYAFDPLDENAMTRAFVKIMEQHDSVLKEMGKRSHDLGMSYTLKDWVAIVRGFDKVEVGG